MSLRLLLICEYPTLNGGENSLLAMLPGVRQAGYEIAAIAPAEGSFADELRRLEIEIEPLPLDPQTGRRQSLPEFRAWLAGVLSIRQPDLIHANSLSAGRISGPPIAVAGIPSISHLRDIIGLNATAIADLNCHRRLLAVSAAVKDWHVGQGLDPARTQVLHNGVDLKKFCPRPPTGYLQREFKLPSDARLIAAIGQIGMRKGLDVLLSACQQVFAVLPDTHLLIVGERHSEKAEAIDYERQLQSLASQSPLSGRVHFLGRRNDLPQLMNELDLLAHAARQEPLGRVLLEGAATGVPIVATDVGGTREIFPENDSGKAAALLVPSGDSADLAQAMIAVLADETAQNRLRQATRTRAETAFARELSLAGLLRHYREVRSG